MNSSTIQRRLERLETNLASHGSPETERLRATAMRAIFKVLCAHYTDDSWTSENLTIGRKTMSMKVNEAAHRLQAGAPTDADLDALGELPADALAVFGSTAKEMLIAVGVVLDQF